MAMPRGRPLSVHLRRRTGALLLAAARMARNSTRTLHTRSHPRRVRPAKVMRTLLHDWLRTPCLDDGFLETAAADACGRRPQGAGGGSRVTFGRVGLVGWVGW